MFDSKRGLLVAIVAVVVLGAAAVTGGYLLGHSTGEDLDAARAAGTQEGQEAGSARGAEEGYAEGFKQGREEGYEATYAEAYEKAYRKAFDDAGVTAPNKVSVPDSRSP